MCVAGYVDTVITLQFTPRKQFKFLQNKEGEFRFVYWAGHTLE